MKHSATVCNGTVAIHVALLALGIGEGDEVIVPSFTYIASVNAIRYTGAKAVFVDSDINTWQIDPSKIEEKYYKKNQSYYGCSSLRTTLQYELNSGCRKKI